MSLSIKALSFMCFNADERLEGEARFSVDRPGKSFYRGQISNFRVNGISQLNSKIFSFGVY
jgi:hypothetical protein